MANDKDKPGLIYLAGPCDFVSVRQSHLWREEIQPSLEILGLSSFSPAHAFVARNIADAGAQKTALAIIKVNQCALDSSDAVLANVAGPSFGTSVECMDALAKDIPVFAFGGARDSVYKHLDFRIWARTYGEAMHYLGEWQAQRTA